jgi:hypothetical protein
MKAIRLIRALAFWLAAGSAAALSAPAWAEGDVKDPISLYGPQLTFDILRNDRPIGEHQVTFRRSGNSLIAESVSTISIPFMIFEAYRFDYRARSTWLDGRMIAIDAVTDDDGAVSTVRVRSDGGAYDVEGPAGARKLAAGLLPTEHWLQPIVESRQLLNTITGDVSNIAVDQLGTERIATAGGKTFSARHYVYRGVMG